MRKAFVAVVLILSLSSALAAARSYVLPEETAMLREGPGSDIAQNNCAACHSLDYITTQPPGKGRAFWEGAVKKMVKTFHAQISDEDAKAIVDYLSATY